ncbi:antimicrobial peptide NK-lysin-like protein [Labeo rohita]|uniref:Antimicrobial peptide NK-lysin-like protein n=1 Tax=Labeo rohita TaxID=84645 RepID=A0A498MIN6_LABRO|nr:antimicrobial peptide NK-lysin-like protein [Labeo rohita]
MLRNIFLVSLLVYAVCAAHWQIREVDSAEDQNEDMCADGIPKPNMCKACKDIIEKDEIKAMVNNTCKTLWAESLCKKFMNKYLHGVIDELMTDDGPQTICTKIHACKPEPPIKEFIVVRDQAHDNF